MNSEALGRRFARLATDLVMRNPRLWSLLRLDSMRTGLAYAQYVAAIEQVDQPQKRALDLGTGTGGAAFAIGRRFPEAEVVGVDIAGQMIEEARRNLPDDLRDRVRFDLDDASEMP